jgi:hypothetical protein
VNADEVIARIAASIDEHSGEAFLSAWESMLDFGVTLDELQAFLVWYAEELRQNRESTLARLRRQLARSR